jgi:hypothetical protein
MIGTDMKKESKSPEPPVGFELLTLETGENWSLSSREGHKVVSNLRGERKKSTLQFY